jgi:hypothetical protein
MFCELPCVLPPPGALWRWNPAPSVVVGSGGGLVGAAPAWGPGPCSSARDDDLSSPSCSPFGGRAVGPSASSPAPAGGDTSCPGAASTSPPAGSRYGFGSPPVSARGSAAGPNGRGPRPRRWGRRRSFIYVGCTMWSCAVRAATTGAPVTRGADRSRARGDRGTERVVASIVGLPEDRGSAAIAQGGIVGRCLGFGCGPGRGIHLP